MSLFSTMGIATGGLDAVSRQLALVSQNVANAGTTGYVREVATLQSVGTPDQPMGVSMGPDSRVINLQMQASLFAQNGQAAAATTTQTALAQVSSALGTPGSSNDLASQIGAVQNAFSSLLSNPSSASAQQQVVSAAQSLTSGINALANTYSTLRQQAQNSIVSDVSTLNSQLATIGQLNAQIATVAAQGGSVAQLQDQQDQAMSTVSSLINVNFIRQGDGQVLAVAGGSMVLPLDSATGPFAMSSATLGPSSAYPGSAPALTLDGQDVTSQITGGTIGGNLTLRDTTLPSFQAALDEVSETLASRTSAQGLNLFTDAQGNVPTPSAPPAVQASYVGFSNTIQVNPAVIATPSLVRDGTQAVAGSPTGAAAFTPNPPGGPSGFSTLIQNVLSYAFGSQVQQGVPQPAPAQTGLGPLGTLTANFGSAQTITDITSAMEADQATAASTAQATQTSAQDLQTTLQNNLNAGSAVSVDTEMSNMVQLQQSYSANARVIAAVQAVWTDLLTAVQQASS